MVPLARIRLVLAGAALLVAAAALTGASGATRDVSLRSKPHRVRTIAVIPNRIYRPVADGRRLAWWIHSGTGRRCELTIQVFDRPTRRLTTIRPDLN